MNPLRAAARSPRRSMAWLVLAMLFGTHACGCRSSSLRDDDASSGADAGGFAGEIDGSVGTGGSAVGGSAGTGTGNACRGFNRTCTLGASCPDLVCGLADSGRRTCYCQEENSMWTCTPCDFTGSHYRDRPDFIPACPPNAADEVPCPEERSVCGPVGAEYCACTLDAQDGLVWDCDDPPTTWQ